MPPRKNEMTTAEINAAEARLPRYDTAFVSFILCFPTDTPSDVVIRRAHEAGYTDNPAGDRVNLQKQVHSARWSYPHLRFNEGDPVPAGVQRLRARVIMAVPATAPIIAELNGTPLPAPTPPPPPPPREPHPLDTEDRKSLQELRDQFEVGDTVRCVSHGTNGRTFEREGRITHKDAAFARVAFGSVSEAVPYKRLTLVPKISGGYKHATPPPPPPKPVPKPAPVVSIAPENKPLRAVPPAFQHVTLPPPAPEPPPPPPPTESFVRSTVVTAPAPAADPTTDYRAWLEMGASIEASLVAAEQTLRAASDALTEQIDKLTAERDAKRNEADNLRANLALLQARKVGG